MNPPNPESLITNAESEGYMLDYLTETRHKPDDRPYFGYRPKFDPEESLKIIRNDPVVRAAAITVVDKIVEGGWRIEGVDERSRKEELVERLKSARFDRLIRKIAYNLIMYNNAFVEIVRDGNGDMRDLNLLETNFVKIDAQPNGDVLGYFQDVNLNRLQDRPYWDAEDVCHIKLDDFTTNVWSELNVKAIYETVLIKDYARQWLHWFFKTNQMRPIMGLQNATDPSVKEFLTYLKAAEKHVDRPIPYREKIDIQRLQEFEGTGASVLELIRWCDEQIMVLMQAPPIAVGFPDKSGRSNSHEQDKSLYTRVRTIHSLLEDDITYDLFRKSNFEKAKLKFNIPDQSTKEKVLENVLTMRNSQFTSEAIVEYMKDSGMVFETDKVFKSDEEIAALSNKDLGTGNEGIKGNQSADAAPSRKRQGTDELQKGNQEGPKE